MDVLLRLKPSEIKVDDLIFKNADLHDPWRVTAVIDKSDNATYGWTKFAVTNNDKDKFVTIYESKRAIVSREVNVVQNSSPLSPLCEFE